MGISNPDESGDGFRKQWAKTINLDAIDNIEIETNPYGVEPNEDRDIQIHIETDEEYGRRVSQILESEKQ